MSRNASDEIIVENLRNCGFKLAESYGTYEISY